MRTKQGWVKANACDPPRQETRVLASSEASLFPASTRRQENARLVTQNLETVIDSLTRLLGDLEPHRSTCLPLAHGCTFDRTSVWCHVSNVETDHVTPPEFTVDGEIKQGEVPLSPRHLQARADSPNRFRQKRWLRADKLALVSGLPIHNVGGRFDGCLHGLSPMVCERDQYRQGAPTDAEPLAALKAEQTIPGRRGSIYLLNLTRCGLWPVSVIVARLGPLS